LLLYRRNSGNGSWVLKRADGHGNTGPRPSPRPTIFDVSNGAKILTFFEAQDAGKKLASGDAEADSSAADHRRWGRSEDYERDSGILRAMPIPTMPNGRAYTSQCAAGQAGAGAQRRRIEALARQPARHHGTEHRQQTGRCVCAALEQAALHDGVSRTVMRGKSALPFCRMRKRRGTSS